jgi:hypothetical protein
VAFVKGIEEAVGWQQAYVVADALHAEYWFNNCVQKLREG